MILHDNVCHGLGASGREKSNPLSVRHTCWQEAAIQDASCLVDICFDFAWQASFGGRCSWCSDCVKDSVEDDIVQQHCLSCLSPYACHVLQESQLSRQLPRSIVAALCALLPMCCCGLRCLTCLL